MILRMTKKNGQPAIITKRDAIDILRRFGILNVKNGKFTVEIPNSQT